MEHNSKSRNKSLHLQLICDRSVKVFNGESVVFLTNGAEATGYSHAKHEFITLPKVN